MILLKSYIIKKFRKSNRIFVDFILLTMFLDLVLQDELDVFCSSIDLFIVPT